MICIKLNVWDSGYDNGHTTSGYIEMGGAIMLEGVSK